MIEEAVNEALPRFYAQAVEESDVRPLGQPDGRRHRGARPAKGGELKFTAEVDVRPEVELPELRGHRGHRRRRRGLPTPTSTSSSTACASASAPSPGRARRADGDFVSIDLSATIDGEEIDDASRGVSYEVGSGTMLEGIDEAAHRPAGRRADATFTAPLAGATAPARRPRSR